MKVFVTKNTHAQYESPIASGLKVMAKVKVFQKYNVGTKWKVLSQGI